METIQQFSNWFSKQKLVRKLAIGCSSLFILCCLCGVSVAIFSPSTPTVEVKNTSVAKVETSPIIAQTEKPSTTFTLAPTGTFILSPTTIVTPIFPTIKNIPGATLQASGNILRFYFINVGQGDATLIQTPDGETMIIDGGEPDTGIVPFLQNLGIQHIDLMIATHPHSDHIGGLVQVLQSFPVTKVVTNGQLFRLTLVDLQLVDDMETILFDTRANGETATGRWSLVESWQTIAS